MTAVTQSRMNAVLALAVPAAGLAYLTSNVSLTSNHSAIGGVVALGVLWGTAIVALNTIQRPRRAAAGRPRDVTKKVVPGRPATSPRYVVDVGRPVIPWRWTSLLLAPVELLALAWSVPFLILLIMVPAGLAVATVLWVGRLIVGL